MSSAREWPGGWAGAVRRIAAAPHAPAVAAALLGVLAAAEALWRGVSAHNAAAARGIPTDGWQFTVVVLVLLSLATTLPVGFSAAQPTVAAVIVTAASVLSLTLFHTLTVAGLCGQLAVLYRAGRSGSPPIALAACVPFPVLALADPGGSEVRVLTVLLASLGPAAALAGMARRAHSEALDNRAARQVIASTLLEHTARGERARIASELHDVVAHHISMVAVQAETARLTTPGMPPAGAQRLSSIGDTARAALTEMRRLLGVLREDAQAVAAERQPQPGLGQLNELLDAARDASGTCTRLILRGPPIPLDPGVELAAYRIVQEALTNARRHAPGAAVDVELHYRDDALRLRIRDNGPGPLSASPPAGHGLPGMRERAAAVGGELRAGPAEGGGFLVDATLPGKTETGG